MSNETKISKSFTKTSLSKLKAKSSKLDKLQSFQSKIFKPTAKKVVIDDVFVSKPVVVFNEGIGILDSFKSSTVQPISFNENISFDEQLKFSFKTVFQDSISAEDLATTKAILNKLLLSDTINVDDELLISSLKDIQLLDNIAASDSISLKDLLKFANTVIVDEGFINNISAINNVSNTVLLNQTFSTILNNSTNLETEPSTANVGDSLTVTMSMLENNLETVNVNDSFSTKLTTQVNLDDSVTPEDSISLKSNLVQNISDTTTVDGTSTNKLEAKVNLSSSTSVLDDFLNNVDFRTSFLGELNINDSTGAAKQYLAKIPKPIDAFNVETDIYNTSISYFIYGVFVKDELVAIVIRNPLLIQLISPASLSTNIANVNFEWEPDEFSNQYELQVATSSNFSTGLIINQPALTSTTYNPVSLLANNTYYWKVRGKNTTNGKFGPWSVTTQFSVVTLQPPVITYPVNNQSTGQNVTLAWNSATFADHYEYQVALDSNFTSLVDSGINSGNSQAIPLLIYNTTYYVRMRSVNGEVVSAWSPTNIFSPVKLSLNDSVAASDLNGFKSIAQFKNTLPAESLSIGENFVATVLNFVLDVPVLSLPVNNATQITSDVYFSWNSVTSATSYRLQLSTDAGFSAIVYDDTVSDTEKMVDNLNLNTTYYWRVRAEALNEQSEWATRQFTTSSNYTPAIYPYQLLSDDPTTKTFINWVDNTNNTNATLYYGVDLNNLQSVSLSNTGTLSGTTARVFSQHITGLTANTSYKCFIVNSNGINSKVWNFTTQPSTLDTNVFRLAFLSDIHIEDTDIESMLDETEMSIVRNENPNILCFVGDLVSQSYSPTVDKSNQYIRFFKEHLNTYLYTNKTMIPMVAVPGNHDVGELNTDNPDTVKPAVTAGYFQLLFNTFKVTNNNNNHGYITFGNYLKLVGIDLFSSNVATQSALISNAGTAQEYVIPFSHFPVLPSTTRNAQDNNYFETVLKGMAPAIYSNANIKAYFSGHMHTRYNSRRWQIINSGTAPTESYLPLGNNNYMVFTNSASSRQEFGQGYKNTRELFSTNPINGIIYGEDGLYVENVESEVGRSTFYIVELKTDVNDKRFNVKEVVINATNKELIQQTEIKNMLEDEIVETEAIPNTTYLAIDWDETQGVWDYGN